MTRQSIEKMAASLKAMHARVKPGHDEFRWGSDQL
jgi:hypothetical protein